MAPPPGIPFANADANSMQGESELDSQKVLAGVDGVLVVFDQPNDDNPYSKTVAMHVSGFRSRLDAYDGR